MYQWGYHADTTKQPVQPHIFLTTLCVLLLAVPHGAGADDVTKLTDELRQAVESGNGKMPAAELDVAASKFSTLLAKTDFSPAPEITAKMREATTFAIAILRADTMRAADIRSYQPPLVAIDTYWSKLTEAFDPNWKELHVTAKITPPAGVTNAAYGMSPDAISDPKLKQQYLDLIAANEKNSIINYQQRELRRSRRHILSAISSLMASSQSPGWEPTATIERYGKDPEAKAILEARLERPRK